ncbi:MAG: hypothetical protein ACLPKB_12380 [Xanthobacteraceae bacterium]
MKTPNHKPARRRQHPVFAHTPEQAIAAHADALYARALWRVECAACAEVSEPRELPEITRKRPADAASRRAQFAMQVARAEFGRFYWQDPLGRPRKSAKAPTNGATRGRR